MSSTRPVSRLTSHASLIAILLAGFGLRLYRLAEQPVWWDEGFSADLARSGLLELTARTAADIHPPLYYYLLHLWVGLAGDGEFSLRFLSVVIGLLLVALIQRVARAWFGAGPAWAAAAVAAASPFYVAYSQEARMYLLETLLALAAAAVGIRLLRGRAPGWLWPAYVTLAALSLYADYFSALTLVALNVLAVGLVLLRIPAPVPVSPRLTAWIAAQIAVLVLYLPWLGIAAGQIGGYGHLKSTAPPLREMARQLWVAFNFGPAYEPDSRWPLLALAAALTLGLAAALLPLLHPSPDGGTGGRGDPATRRPGDPATRRPGEAEPFAVSPPPRVPASPCPPSLALAVGLALLPVVLFMAAMQVRPFFHVRYLMVATPAYYLLVGLAVAGWWRLFRPAGLAALAGILVIFGLGAQGYYFDPAFAKDDTRAVGRVLAAELGASDLALWQTPQPFWYYYRGPARTAYLPADLNLVGQRLSELAEGRRRVAWAVWKQGDNDPWNVVPYLLARAGDLVAEHVVRGYRVLVYELSAPSSFQADRFDPVPPPNRFGDGLELTGLIGPPSRTEAADRSVAVGLRFRALRAPPPGQAFKAFLHLRDEQGRLVGQVDSFLYGADRAPSGAFRGGEEGFAFLAVPAAPGTGPGGYRLEVGAYVAPADPSVSARPESVVQLGLVGGSRAVYDLGGIVFEPPRRPWTSDRVRVARPPSLEAPGVRLLGLDGALAEGEAIQVRPGERIELGLLWQKTAAEPGADERAGLWLEPANRTERLAEHWEPIGPASYRLTRWRPGEVLRERRALPIGPDVGAGTYRLMAGLGSAQAALGAVSVAGRPVRFDPPAPASGVARIPDERSARWHEGERSREVIALWGYRLAQRPAGGSEAELNVEAWWQALGPMAESYTAFVHLVGPDGQIWAQADRLPLGGAAPTSGWAAGEYLADRYPLTRKPGAPPGDYRLLVGWYLARSGQRLALPSGDAFDVARVTLR